VPGRRGLGSTKGSQMTFHHAGPLHARGPGRRRLRRLLVLLAAAAALLVLPAVAQASIYPQSIVFGNTTQTQTQWISLNNDSGHDWYVYYPSFFDGQAYSVVYSDCGSLSDGSSCSIELQFNAGDGDLPAGWYYDTMYVEHYDYSYGYSTYDYVSLSGGKDALGTVSVSPGSIDFGARADPVVQTITVRNDKNEPVDVSRASINGGAPYSITVDACGVRLASGESCGVDVRFDPGSNPGTFNDSLALMWTDSGDHQERVPLTATVPAPPPPNPADLTLTPNLIRFGKARRPVTSTVTVQHDTEAATARIDAVAGTGAFTVVRDRCTGRSLGANQTCSFRIRFQAAVRGRFRGRVSVISTNSARGEYATLVSGRWLGGLAPTPYVSRGRLSFRSFSPRVHDGRRDNVRYRFRSGIAHAGGRIRGGPFVTVEVWNRSFSRLVRSWTFHQRRAAIRVHSIRWNGRSNRGRLVRAGVYHVHALVRSPRTESAGTRANRWSTVRVRRGR
jgi:hypothetical protein